jgi:hypothetical protein
LKLEDHIVIMKKKVEGEDEDAFLCKWCTDHCYLSMVQCSEHACPNPEIGNRDLQPSGESTDEKSPIKQERGP